MNLKAKITLLMAALLIGVFAIPALAACPAGTIDLSDPANYGAGNAIQPTTAPGVAGVWNITQPGTYCVPSGGLDLTAFDPDGAVVAVWAAADVTGYVVTVSNVTIVGETPCARLLGTTPVAAVDPIITVNMGLTGVVIHNFTLDPTGLLANGINETGSGVVIEGMTFDGSDAAADFPAYAVQLNGTDPIVQNNTFDMTGGTTGAAILLSGGGMGARIINNDMTGILAATPTFFVGNNVAIYNDAEIRGNNVLVGVGQFVGQVGANSFTNSMIAGNTAITWGNGIDLGATSSNTTVDHNTLTYGASNVVNTVGILDGGGSNLHYTNNTVTASTGAGATPGDGIRFLSSNAVINGNTIDARGTGVAANGDGIDATGNNPVGAAGASNATITNNTILGTGLAAGINGFGIVFSTNANTNFTVAGNTISNTGRGGIIAANLAGGGNHTISNNTITNTGLLGAFPFSSGIATNGNCLIQENTITDVKAGIGILSIGPNDRIIGNTIRSVSAVVPGGSGITIWWTGGNTTIHNNTIENISGAFGNGITLLVANADIKDNKIDGVYGGDGIQLSDTETIIIVSAGVSPGNAGNQTITGNTIKNVTNGVGIALYDQDNNVITGNTIENTGRDGISAYAVAGIIVGPPGVPVLGWTTGITDANNNTITNNTITGAARQAADVAAIPGGVRSQRYAAILLEGQADNNTVDNNTIVDTGSSAGAASYAVGIDLLAGGGADPDNNDITNNTLSGFTTVAPGAGTSVGIRVLSGQNNTVVGNTVKNSGNLQYGIDIRTVNELPVTDNTVEGMLKGGLYLWGGTAANPLDVQGNTLTDNVHGINMMAGAAQITNVNVITGGAIGLYVDPMANATNFDVCGVCNNVGNCITACILCQNDGLGTLNVRGNYWGLEPIQGATIFGNVDFSDALAVCPGDPGINKTHTYGAVAGWYMVSCPLNSGLAADIFGATAYRWNPALGDYDVVVAINAAQGFWVMLPAGKSVTDNGEQVVTDVTLDISTAGWHQISAPWSYPKSAIQVTQAGVTKSWADAATAGWVRDDIYGYVATDGAYTTPSTMNPWYGYWVRAEVSGLSLKLLVASGTPVSRAYAPMASANAAPLAFAPADLPPMPPTFTPSAATLSFGNSPNPVVDVNTTYFEVKGAAAYLVEALKVQIYDLSGRLVYEAEEAGASMAWHTDNIDGEYLANGVYLYKLYALFDGQWVVSGVKNVVILR